MTALTSNTIKSIRLPLAILVVFIHNFGTDKVDTLSIDYGCLLGCDFYDLIRVAISNVIAHGAVPCFFLISGYLFFQKYESWTLQTWKTKFQTRIQSVLIPYILWITVAISITIFFKIGGVLLYNKPITGIIDFFASNNYLHMFWDCKKWNLDLYNIFGWQTYDSAPYLVPLWFMRDLIVTFLFTPVIAFCVKKIKLVFVILLFILNIFNIWIILPGFSSLSIFYFTIGSWIAIEKGDLVFQVSKFKTILIILWVLMTPFMIYYNGHNTHVGWMIYPIYLLVDALFFIYVFSVFVRKYNENMLAMYSNATFIIYAAHVLVMPYYRKGISLLSNGLLGDYITYFVPPMMTVLTCILLNHYLNKYFVKTAKYFGCR